MHPKGLIALAGIVLVAKLTGAMFIVGMIWVWMVAPLWVTLVYTLGRRRSPKIPRRL